MMMGEFVTLLQTRLPVKIVVLNNGTLGFVEMEMKASGFLDTNVDLTNPNFAEMARQWASKAFASKRRKTFTPRFRRCFGTTGLRFWMSSPPARSW